MAFMSYMVTLERVLARESRRSMVGVACVERSGRGDELFATPNREVDSCANNVLAALSG
jgi:hypothetical protein